MVISDENRSNLIRPTNMQGGLEVGTGKLGQRQIRQTRRALGVINQSLLGAPAYPCVVNKRPFTQKHEVYEKKQADPAHRPITRKFAAQISTQPSCFEEVKIPKVPNKADETTNSAGFGDCISIFVDDEFKSPEGQAEAMTEDAEPMFLEQEESTPEEANDTKEVEMEDIVEEPLVDIDGGDLKNPLAVVDYVEDLYAYYRRMEGFSCVPPNYLEQQCDINEKMRAILIDWLIEVHDKFELLKETLFLTVNLIDRFLSQHTVVRKKLQLVGLVAMLLACKYEEVSVPIVGDLILISDKAYTRNDVLEMENMMLNTLQFNMSVPTPYVFMNRFLKAAQSDKKIELLSFFLIELSRGVPNAEVSTISVSCCCSLHCSMHSSRVQAMEQHLRVAHELLGRTALRMLKFDGGIPPERVGGEADRGAQEVLYIQVWLHCKFRTSKVSGAESTTIAGPYTH